MTMSSSHQAGGPKVALTLVEATRLAYIKPMGAAEAYALRIVPDDMDLPKDFTLYAIHAADGTRLAVMENWEAAYGAALENELVPVSLH
ncbi:MAG: DUF1150 family protein [Alphaproteobacteria bacterium]